MSVAQLLGWNGVKSVGALDVNNPVYINPVTGSLTFAAIGSGTGTWSATVVISAIHAQVSPSGIGGPFVADSTAITLTISNTTPATSTVINTNHRYYQAYVSSISGAVTVYATVEG